MRKSVILFVLILFPIIIYSQKFEGLAQTPPMGWNSWNKFACNVSESLIRETADEIASNGMKDAGYEYIVIDDCWQGQRDSLGFIHPDPQKFPSGMKALADYIHSKGLKFGIYSDAGWETCGGRPGSRGHEYQDAIQYAKWGVDYLKYDWCNTEEMNAGEAYMTMSRALRAAGRPIVFSLCEWGNNKPWKWGTGVGHLWRTTGDISPCFDCYHDYGTWKSWGITYIIGMQHGLRVYAGPGHWNDPDMLEVGNGMSVSEDRAHFSMWCMLAAPLMAGNDLSNMSNETKNTLTNKEVIAVDQDPLGIEGFRHSSNDSLDIWLRPLDNDNWAVCFLNLSKNSKDIDYKWNDLQVTDKLSNREIDLSKTNYSLRDLWKHENTGTTGKNLTVKIPGHDVLMLRLSPVKK